MLDGKKSYLVVAATILYAAAGAFIGEIEVVNAIGIGLGALGLGGLRHAIK